MPYEIDENMTNIMPGVQFSLLNAGKLRTIKTYFKKKYPDVIMRVKQYGSKENNVLTTFKCISVQLTINFNHADNHIKRKNIQSQG